MRKNPPSLLRRIFSAHPDTLSVTLARATSPTGRGYIGSFSNFVTTFHVNCFNISWLPLTRELSPKVTEGEINRVYFFDYAFMKNADYI